MGKIVYKRFSIDVSDSGETVNKKFELDRNISRVLGLQLTSSRPELMFYRGSQRLEISGDELFPEGYESRLLQSGITTPPNERFFALGDGVTAGNGEVKVLYKDEDDPVVAFEPYTVIIALMCELEG